MIENKKGNIVVIIVFFSILFLLLALGFVLAIGSSVVQFVFDTSAPLLTDLGATATTGTVDANFTQIAGFTIVPINNLVQNLTWMTGVLYVLALIGSIGVVISFKATSSRWLIGFYFMLTIMLVLAAMFISNMYEDFYRDTGELGDILKDHALLSWLILYSPGIFTAIAFITGIILFAGGQEDEFT